MNFGNAMKALGNPGTMLSIGQLNKKMTEEKERLRKEAEENKEKFLESKKFVTRRSVHFRKETDIVELRFMNKVMKDIAKLKPKQGFVPNRIPWGEPESPDYD